MFNSHEKRTLVIPEPHVRINMTKALKIVVAAARILSIPGLIIGIVFSILSYTFHSKFNDYRENGQYSEGVIRALYDNNNPRYTSFFADLNYKRFEKDGSSHSVTAKRVEVYFKAARDLHVGEVVGLYYKPGKQSSELLLTVNYEPDNVPLSRKPWWGWGITIVSASIAASYQISRLLKKRKEL